jgi:NAD(P)-dependent dehydrogenase (short-subunit alcohol dehydrogenase family)
MTLDELLYKPSLLQGQRILITGGGTGLGRVMAEACLLLGATVYICGRRAGVLEKTAAELMTEHGGKVVGLACDIREVSQISDARCNLG